MRELLAKEIAGRVKDGDTIGFGTGTTVEVAINQIAKRVKDEGLRIAAVPTSIETAQQCEQLGIAVLSSLWAAPLSWGFDGADEVDPKLRLIKGRGGALLQEKILAAKCKHFVVIVDEGKLVARLGEKFPVPVEVIPAAQGVVENGLKKLGGKNITLRQATGKHGPIITEGGNLILDVNFDNIADTLERDIKALVGVVENGIFTKYAHEVLVAGKDGLRMLR